MSSPTLLKRGFAGIVVAGVLALFVGPAAALAAPVNLATAAPFVALAGSAVTNSGPSVLNGDLGVSPGTALTEFGFPAVVNGATHQNDAVAAQAQSDLTNAYNVAAGQPVAPADDLSGTNLGNRILGPGAYRYTSAALLTGALTLDAEGDPNAQFVFEIGSSLTTASASSVVLVNGASPCNVHWQVESSATLGTTTKFVGNLMALTSISLNNGASVIGRLLARNGQISLINNVLTKPTCAGEVASTPSSSGGSGTPGTSTTPGTPAGVATPTRNGKKTAGQNKSTPKGKKSGTRGRAIVHTVPRPECTAGFRVSVTGRMISRVVFSLDGTAVRSLRSSPFAALIKAPPGSHRVRVRVTFKDATPAKTETLPYRACASALLEPRQGPSQFTG